MSRNTIERNGLVWRKLDPYEPPAPPTPKQQQELRELEARDDSEIDTSDIPPLDEEFFRRARPFRELYEERRLEREARRAAAAKAAAE